MNDALTSMVTLLEKGFQRKILLKLTWHRANEERYVSTISLGCTPLSEIEAVRFLHPLEYQFYQTAFSPVRRDSFIRGRYCAKQALHSFLSRQPADVCILNGVFGQPFILDNSQNLGISIAHSVTMAVATAFPEHYPMGIDIEEWQGDVGSTLAQQWTPDEQQLLKQATHPYQPLLFWSAKEALAKVLKTGFTLPLSLLELLAPEPTRPYQIILFKNFIQYKAIVFSWGNFVLALVVPANSELINCQYITPF